MKKPNNDEIIGDANESMEITYVRLDKLLNEEIGKPDEKTNNKKNIDKGSEQNNKESINKDNDSDKQKTNKNTDIGSVGSKDTHKDNNIIIEKIINSKDNNKKQEENKTLNRNINKDIRERQNREKAFHR